MSYAGDRYWLTYNGEIYNFIELREELQRCGHSFVSDSDSEVILAAYAQWGDQCQSRFNGMWAFAIWDDHDKRLFLSRDRFAVKPVYYADVNGSFSFASELKSFLHLDWCDGSFDQRVLLETLHHPSGQEAEPETIMPSVKRLLGGHCLTLDHRGLRVRQWWNTLQHLCDVPNDLAAQTAQFRELFLDACRLRLRSDVPIATSLSGGLDSSAVACSIVELRRQQAFDHVPLDWQRAFVACFPGTPLDEQRYAEQVVTRTGMHPHYYAVDESEVIRQIETIIYDLETIFNNPLVGAWAIYREMRRNGIPVSLDGHGSDELIGGYHYFVDAAIDEMCGPRFRLQRYRDLKRIRAGLAGGTNIAQSGERLPRRSLSNDLRVLAKQTAAQLGVIEPLRTLLRRKSSDGAILPELAVKRGWHVIDNRDQGTGTALSRMQFTWFNAGLLPTFLNCIDRASMAHGIEVRMPFLDWRLVTFCMSLPDESKIGGGYTKRILRLAMENLMPDAIRLRTQKVHFSSPIGEWSRGGLKTWMLDIGASQSFLQGPVWNGEAARVAIEQAVSGRAAIHPVWPVINAHVLQARFKAARETAREKQRRMDLSVSA